jgi:hypothetical protein
MLVWSITNSLMILLDEFVGVKVISRQSCFFGVALAPARIPPSTVNSMPVT